MKNVHMIIDDNIWMVIYKASYNNITSETSYETFRIIWNAYSQETEEAIDHHSLYNI